MTNGETISYFKECNEILVSAAKDENVYDYEKQVIEADCMREQFEANEKAIQALEQQPCERMTLEEVLYKHDDIEVSNKSAYRAIVEAFHNVMNMNKYPLLTADEKADVLNLINETLENKGYNLEVAEYEDDGTFFNVHLWKRNPEGSENE